MQKDELRRKQTPTEKADVRMQKDELGKKLMPREKTNYRERTKDFALRIIPMFSTLPKTTEAQVLGKPLNS